MNSEELKHIEEKIAAEILKTKAAILHYKELTKPIAPENAIGRVSRMDAINNKSVNEAALKKAEQKLKNLQIALSNISDVDFGLCYKCKNSIPLGRILLMPHTHYCVHCAS
ncbi:TraR/DksA family transcriptional regulator [Pontimicrobium aquaticum]|uniref:TraR/DksA family transcriptional regulator n=1 Tax=Pontimicrobium aquaticum TaxID=2565367 RepID=A0A4U0EKB7_9FLAO|nr:TraR/DksA C4-type zinc finger protein [Pontimicrobium aquaticum]TJY31885.1 TraR/DksA family transcriptional regulator [Pontimicrobium aquaticum]